MVCKNLKTYTLSANYTAIKIKLLCETKCFASILHKKQKGPIAHYVKCAARK